MKKNIFLFISFFCSIGIFGQQIQMLNLDKQEISFRGLAVLDEFIFWVSGSEGTVGFSVNAGKSIKWVNPKGYEDRDFRMIEVLSPTTAVVAAVGSPGIILKTEDNGVNWKEVYRDEHPDVFIDVLQFTAYNPKMGIAVGDPINGNPYILKTTDGGNSWKKIDDLTLEFEEGEAFFAASNSNISLIDEDTYIMATGGKKSRLILISDLIVTENLPKSSSLTAGVNALDFSFYNKFGLIAGGDFENKESSENNLIVFELEGMKSFKISFPETPPNGYKSGVAIFGQSKAVACGLMGVDLSVDKGKTWQKVTTTPFHACKKSKKGNKIYLVGAEGRIAHFLE